MEVKLRESPGAKNAPAAGQYGMGGAGASLLAPP